MTREVEETLTTLSDTHSLPHSLLHSVSSLSLPLSLHFSPTLTSNVQSDVLVIKFLRAYGHLETTSRLSHLLPAVLGHHLMAAMVHIDTTLRALLALFHEPIEEGATVVAPCRVQVCGGAKLVWCGNLSRAVK